MGNDKYWSVSQLEKYARSYEVKKQTVTTSGINTGLFSHPDTSNT